MCRRDDRKVMRMYANLEDLKNIPEENREEQLKAAERDVDRLTYNRIVKIGFDHLTEYQQELVKEATIAQADFRQAFGAMLASPLASYGINGVSMSFDAKRLVMMFGTTTTLDIYGLLQQTGLTYRGLHG